LRTVTGSLGRLGSGVQLEHVRDADRCIALCSERPFDLVVLESSLGAACHRILAEVRRGGPPVIVTGQALSDEQALEMFRRGAADCVALTTGAEETLLVAALEQIQRARAVRERGTAQRRIRDLERYTENIIRNMNSALLVVDLEGRITYCNAPAGNILGEDSRALRGREVWKWFRGVGNATTILSHTLGEDPQELELLVREIERSAAGRDSIRLGVERQRAQPRHRSVAAACPSAERGEAHRDLGGRSPGVDEFVGRLVPWIADDGVSLDDEHDRHARVPLAERSQHRPRLRRVFGGVDQDRLGFERDDVVDRSEGERFELDVGQRVGQGREHHLR
jgi:PAS domain-containing protein